MDDRCILERNSSLRLNAASAAGAMVVDMEASAIMAWANFRQAKVYQILLHGRLCGSPQK